MTEIRHDEATSHIVSGPPPLAPVRGPIDWVTSADHRRIGQLYVVLSLLMGVGALVVGALAGFERFDPADELFEGAGLQLASLAALALPFATVMPLLAGLAIAVVPQQVGARTIAFPRAAALSVWLWLSGVGLMIGAYAANGGPGGGDSDGVELFLLALGMVAVALCVASVCIGTTVLTLRAPGMYLDRTPFFSWGSMVGAVLTLLTLPVLVGLLALLYVDHRYSRLIFGGNVGVWSHISWVVRQPSTLIVALPALGILADVIPVMARTRQQLAGAVYAAIGLAGALAFGAWAQDALAPEVRTEALFLVVSVASVLPVLAVVALGGLTLKSGGKPQVSAALIASRWGGLMLLAGVVNGALVGLEILDVSDLSIVGTTAEMSQADYLYLGALLIALGGLAFWAPKLLGRRLPDAPMRGLVTLGFLATVAAALPNVLLGYIEGQPAYATDGYPDGDLTAALNIVAAAGAALWALVLLGAVALIVKELATGSADESDPWGGHTLEWADAPVTGVVGSDRPVLDLREASK